MISTISILSTAAFLASIPFSGATYVSDSKPTQYILFNGTISGKATWSSGSCAEKSAGPYIQTYLYVGVNPPWDPNPFFFELSHVSSESTGGFISFTKDLIYNLDFTSAGRVCYGKDGKPCGIVEINPYYVVDRALDLSKAKVSQTDVSGQKGYTVEGGSDAWVSNGTLVNGVDARFTCSSWDWNKWTWNASTPFTYSLSFTNTTASFKLTTSPANVGSLTLEFSGQRTDNTTTSSSSSSSSSTEKYPIELDTSDSSKPGFRFVNDTAIAFTNSSGTWKLQSSGSSSGSSSSTSSSTRSGSGSSAPTSTSGSGSGSGSGSSSDSGTGSNPTSPNSASAVSFAGSALLLTAAFWTLFL